MANVATPEVSTHALRGVRRRQYQPLWDETTITSAATDARFFDNIAGKQAHRCNLEKPHELPFREHYEVWGVRLVPRFVSLVAAMIALYDLSAIEFGINTRPVLKLPTCMVLAGCGLCGINGYAGAIANVSAIVQNGTPDPGAIIAFDEPFLIGKGETFYCNLLKEAGLGAVGPLVAKMILEGYIWKTTQ